MKPGDLIMFTAPRASSTKKFSRVGIGILRIPGDNEGSIRELRGRL